MSRLQALFLIFLLWAAIYLPGLGSTELKGEEGRRILPAVTMLQTGNWIVPYVGGFPFLRKPPLIQWVIAASFKITGVQNEWSARLPSVLGMLALVITLIAVADPRKHSSGERPRWMSPETAFVASIFCLTQTASIEKGRLAEIEGVYVAISGIAVVLWLAFWAQRRSPWVLWLVPAVFLGLGCLAKLPLHLLFFYAIVGVVLRKAGDLHFPRPWWHWLAPALFLTMIFFTKGLVRYCWILPALLMLPWLTRSRTLWQPAHIAALALMLGLVSIWGVPYFMNEATVDAAKVWEHQLTERVGGRFNVLSWVLAVPRGLGDHLPWLLFAPLLWRPDLSALGERPSTVVCGGRGAIGACFVGLLLIPGVLPRYVQPLLAPFSCLLALSVADERLAPRANILRCWWRANSVFAGLVLLAACLAPGVLAFVSRKDILAVRGEGLGDFAQYLTWPLLASSAASAVAIAALVGRWKLARPALMAATSGALVGAAMFIFASSGMPLMNRHAPVRQSAQEISGLVPAGQKLYIYDPGIKPAIFYLTVPYQYAPEIEDIPADAQWVLTRPERRERLLGERPELELVRAFSNKESPLLLLHRRTAG